MAIMVGVSYCYSDGPEDRAVVYGECHVVRIPSSLGYVEEFRANWEARETRENI